MLPREHKKDKYSQFSYNATTGRFERGWVRYADGVYEPERCGQLLEAKWPGKRYGRCWWHETKPVDWLPWHHGFGFSWNHTLGEEAKPATWGDKTKEELKAGAAPYFAQLTRDSVGRVISRTERIDGRRETWTFKYDEHGALSACVCKTGWSQDYHYQDGLRLLDYEVGREPFMRFYQYDCGRLSIAEGVEYSHDENGFRSGKKDASGKTQYIYEDDGRLLRVELPCNLKIKYEYDEDGRRTLKMLNGEPVEAYDWEEGRLARFFNGEQEYEFIYDGAASVPHLMHVEQSHFVLEYDHVNTLKAVVTDAGQVVKAMQRDPFGLLLWDSNPGFRVPFGFAGGLDDLDTALVCLHGREYDPETGRWTSVDRASQEMGSLVLSDPVNLTPSSS